MQFLIELHWTESGFNLFFFQFGGKDLDGDDVTAETIKKQMTDQEWQKIYQMSKDKNLYQNLINSIFPTIHGKLIDSFDSTNLTFTVLTRISH